MVELLAPAGSREALVAAVESGANAVYLAGNMFGARAYANNFDEEGMREAIAFAHQRNVLVHVTVNTIVDDQEIPQLVKYLRFLYEAGADAVLVQDLGVARIVRDNVPELPMHASTQMTVHNLDGVLALQNLGFSRVVLSRELSLAAIKEICDNCNVEIEVFVHGALCVCYSGQCLMSSVIGGRSGNRGRCAQPCRLPYTLVDAQDNDLLGDSAGKYLLSPRDMKGIDLLPQLIEAGVSSLKIEGRMKRPEYVAIVVGSYRHAIDSYYAGSFAVMDDDTKALTQIFNRDFTTAYMEKKQGRNMMSDKRPNNRGLMLGRVMDFDRDTKMVTLKLNTDLAENDQVDFWVKVGGRVTATIKDLQLNISNTKGKNNKKNKNKANTSQQVKLLPVTEAKAGDVVSFAVESWVYPGDRAFKVYDARLMNAAKEYYASGAPVRRFPVNVWVKAAVGEPMTIVMEDMEGSRAEAQTDFIGQQALKRPLSEETVAKQIARLGTSIFALNNLSVDIQGEVMVPVSEINEARRKCVEALEAMRLEKWHALAKKASAASRQSVEAAAKKMVPLKGRFKADNTDITVVVDSLGKLSRALLTGVDRVVFGGESYSHEFITDDMYQKAVELAHGAGAEIVFNTPRIIRQSDVPAFHKWLENIAHSGADGISVHNIGTLYAVQQYTDIPVEADYSLISYNQETLKHLSELGAVRAVLSPELNFTQIEALGKNTPLALECMVEGNLELMVSEYCCTGSFLGDLHTGKCSAPCVRSGKKFFLKDRKDVKFPLVMDQYCHMHLLNGNRLSMLPHAMRFKAMNIASIRIDGRFMDEDSLSRAIKNYRKYMNYSQELSEVERAITDELEGDRITRGHYFRGVE